MFISAATSFCLYTLVFLKLRGNIINHGRRFRFRWISRSEAWTSHPRQSDSNADAHTMKVAKHMLLYPVRICRATIWWRYIWQLIDMNRLRTLFFFCRSLLQGLRLGPDMKYPSPPPSSGQHSHHSFCLFGVPNYDIVISYFCYPVSWIPRYSCSLVVFYLWEIYSRNFVVSIVVRQLRRVWFRLKVLFIQWSKLMSNGQAAYLLKSLQL